jgi:hypothetical protein
LMSYIVCAFSFKSIFGEQIWWGCSSF